MEYTCPGCKHSANVEPVGHYLCPSCKVYGFDFDLVPGGPGSVPIPEDTISEPPTYPLHPEDWGCEGCTQAERDEYARMFPKLDAIDREFRASRD